MQVAKLITPETNIMDNDNDQIDENENQDGWDDEPNLDLSLDDVAVEPRLIPEQSVLSTISRSATQTAAPEDTHENLDDVNVDESENQDGWDDPN
jgi:hypothetical protein